MKASSLHQRNRRAKNYAQLKDPADPRHGTPSFYQNHGCRCERCTTASSQLREEQMKKKFTAGADRTTFAVVEYVNVQGSRIIAVMDDKAMWNVLCLTESGYVHYFKWTFDSLTADVGAKDVKQYTR